MNDAVTMAPVPDREAIGEPANPLGLAGLEFVEYSAAVADLVRRLVAMGCRGDYSVEVFNDDYQQVPMPLVARRARGAAVWLGETVLRRSRKRWAAPSFRTPLGGGPAQPGPGGPDYHCPTTPRLKLPA